MAKFKQEVIELIKADADLFAIVAKALDVKPTSVHETLKRNGRALNQYNVVTAVAHYLGKPADELIQAELMEEPQS